MNLKISKIFVLIIFALLFSFGALAQSPHFKNHSILKGKKNFTVNTVFQDKMGYLWFGTSEGLVKYDGITYKLFTIDDNLQSNNISCISQDTHRRIWIGFGNGKISLFENDSISSFLMLDNLLTESISKIIFTNNQTWIGTTGNGLIKLENDEIKQFNSESEIGDDYIYDIEVSPTGKIYFGTDIGILIYDDKNEKWENFSMKDGIPDNIIREIEIDEEGVIWLGMEDKGLAIYDPETNNVKLVPLWNFGSLNHFVLRSKNEIWVSTRNEGAIKLQFNNIEAFSYKKYTPANGLINNQTVNVFKDNENNVWIAAKNGVSQYAGNLFEFLNTNEGLPSKEVFSFIIDSKQNHWICTKKGLFVLTKAITGEFSSNKLLDGEKFSTHSYTSLYEDNNGSVWVGTYGFGVYRFNIETLKHDIYNTKKGLSNDNIISINGKENKVWFSTFGGGIDYCAKCRKQGLVFYIWRRN